MTKMPKAKPAYKTQVHYVTETMIIDCDCGRSDNNHVAVVKALSILPDKDGMSLSEKALVIASPVGGGA